MIINLLLLITINFFIADGITLNESLLNKLGFSKSSSNITINSTDITEIDTNAFKEYTNITNVKLTLYKLSRLDLKVFKSSSANLISIWILAPSLTKFTNSEKIKFPSMQKLDLCADSLVGLDSDVLNGLSTMLSFGHSFLLSTLQPNQFSSLKKLEVLRLIVKNQISLSKTHFNGLTSLKTLGIHSSNIQKIDNDTFNGLTNLENLNLRNNSLNQLDLSNTSGKLHSLILGQNNLSYLRIPKRLDSLVTLDLSNNRFRSFGSIDFRAFPNLIDIDISKASR